MLATIGHMLTAYINAPLALLGSSPAGPTFLSDVAEKLFSVRF